MVDSHDKTLRDASGYTTDVRAGTETNLQHTVGGTQLEERQYPQTSLSVLDGHQLPHDPSSPSARMTKLTHPAGLLRALWDGTLSRLLQHTHSFLRSPEVRAASEGPPPRGRFLLRAIGTRRVPAVATDRKSTRLNSSHLGISYAVF